MIALYWILVLVMIVGVIGAVAPGIPGTILIVTAITIWGIVQGFNTVSIALIFAVFALVLNMTIDFLAAYLGAKQVGASSWGQWGAIIGLTLGILGLLPALPLGGPLIGLILGALLGACIGEFLYRRELKFIPRVKLALKAGVGIIVGSLVGQIIQGLVAIASVLVFLFTTFPQGVN